jgi:hypothetical protein
LVVFNVQASWAVHVKVDLELPGPLARDLKANKRRRQLIMVAESREEEEKKSTESRGKKKKERGWTLNAKKSICWSKGHLKVRRA